jgi:hypothetical protein
VRARTRRGRVTVSWRAVEGAAAYRVRLALRDRRRAERVVGPGRRRVRFAGVRTRSRVTVRALSASGVASRARAVQVQSRRIRRGR